MGNILWDNVRKQIAMITCIVFHYLLQKNPKFFENSVAENSDI